VLIVLLPVPATALETDQFYAWTRPLRDASDAINARINADLSEVLARVDARHDPTGCTCRTVQNAIRSHFDYGIIARPELWATKTSLLDRVPATPEEEPRFRHAYLYGQTSAFDPVLWMPPSPTIEIAGIRIGADKLGHFFSDGAWTEESYRRALKKGASEDEAQRQAVLYSVGTERTIWGAGTSGILSLADLEANFKGLLFYRGLCGGAHPTLRHTPGGWRLERPFDIRDYVSPEWDESWEPNVYTRYRWAKVKPVMLRYCALLQDPQVRRRRTAYAALDRETPTETIVRQLVASGKMADPSQFGIEAACGVAPSAAPRDSGR
jgi:hypothetical protein